MKILVLNARGLNLGYLGCYGNEWVETPTLNRLAADGVVFDQHIADCPSPDPASASCRTGHYRFPLPGQSTEENRDLPSIESLLREHGAAHAFLTDRADEDLDDFLGHVEQAIDRLAGASTAMLWLDWPNLQPPWEIPDEILELYFSEEVGADASLTPWFDPPVGPVDDEQLERLQETYAAAITCFDTFLEMLFEILDEHGGRDQWLVVLTAHSGLALGEHGVVGQPRAWLHEELVHVPLVLRFPDKQFAGLRILSLTQPVDLLPTLLELLQLPAIACDGRSLLPLMREEASELRAYACSGLRIGSSLEWALRTPDWAFLLPLEAPEEDEPADIQLYVKPDDRWEVNNLAQQYLELCEELEQTLRAFVAGDATAPLLHEPDA